MVLGPGMQLAQVLAAAAALLIGCSGSGARAPALGMGGNPGSGGSPVDGQVGSGGAAGSAAPPPADAGIEDRPNADRSDTGVSGDAGAEIRDAADAAGSTVVPPTGPQTCGTTWTNPITAGAHDPSLVKEASAYYVFSTADGIDTTRRVPLLTSSDRLHWTNLGTIMKVLPSWTSALGLVGTLEIWAPDVHYQNGKYFLYYSVSAWGDVTHSAIGLMTNATLDPSAANYQWIDQGKVVGSPEGGAGVNVIDPDLFVDDDGSWWLVYGSYQAGIRLVPLDPTTGLWNRTSAPVTLTTSLGEGSDIIKNNGFYYLFVSRGTCCAGLSSTYEVVYGRATKVTGPYLGKTGAPINGASVNLLPAGSDGNPGQGGQAFFKENGQYYMAYHAYQRPTGNAVLNVRPIYFDATDWVTLDPCLAKGYRP
jgi:arabinan endo-1,5-alpha-L-arabinosidase